MPRIDFYILPDQALNGRELLACRLAEKAYQLGHKVYIYTSSAAQARLVDELLWTFRQGSFVPHTLCPFVRADPAPVLIGWEEMPENANSPLADCSNPSPARPMLKTVLINLSAEAPATFERFARVAELVNQDPQVLAKSRERFRYYRDRGYSPTSHKL